MKINKDAAQELEKFKKEPKFEAETSGQFYQGLSKSELKPKLSELLSLSASDFMMVIKNQPTEEKFLDKIKVGLERFNPYYLDLDTEDREKICHYFEELMDCVGLESSNGLLNNWMYNFDPTKKN